MNKSELARSAGISRSTLLRRMEKYGLDAEQAAALPHNRPDWMLRVSQEEGQSVEEILRAAARCSGITGYGLVDHAKEWGVPRSVLGYWSNKWGIVWSTKREEARANG